MNRNNNNNSKSEPRYTRLCSRSGRRRGGRSGNWNKSFLHYRWYAYISDRDEEYAEGSDILKDEDYIIANDVVLEAESDDYQRGYMNALSAQQR